ncbi:MAG TPA: hypothetical protein PL155_08120 [Candidatus Omnitrophota bacterium]|nr:hypothetical protein [Candidatus Omnitrophota bacterium]HPD85203.1 hypothetical protein [Candidatus Omnitrophota bacterium]HRZ04296.1 hypothetical protein [Candidatus Omnitrophota bacterium]
MAKTSAGKNVLILLRNSLNTLVAHPVIFFPLCITVFLQLLVLEILYFAPRWPLSVFFGPVIRKLFGEGFLHFPYNFQLIQHLFFYCQIPLYLFVDVFLVAVAIGIVVAINNDKPANPKIIFKKILPQYIHIFAAALLTFLTTLIIIQGYDLLFARALRIRSETGIFFMIKSVIVYGRPYFGLLIDIFISAIFLYIVPLIVIEKLKIQKAFLQNFSYLKRAFLFTLGIVFIPTLVYIPVIMLRSIVSAGDLALKVPIMQAAVIILSILVKLFVEAVILTSVTTYYFLTKENK